MKNTEHATWMSGIGWIGIIATVLILMLMTCNTTQAQTMYEVNINHKQTAYYIRLIINLKLIIVTILQHTSHKQTHTNIIGIKYPISPKQNFWYGGHNNPIKPITRCGKQSILRKPNKH